MKTKFLDELYEAVLGGNSIGHQSLVVSVCEEFNQPQLDWSEALELLQENDYEVAECPCCGWVADDNGNYSYHSDHEEGVCDSFAEEEE